MFWHQCAWQTSVPMCIWHTQAPAVLVPFHFQLPLWCVVPTPQSQCTAITVIYCYSPHSHHAGTSVYLDDNTAVSPVMKGQGWCNFISNAHTGLATIFICVCLSKGKQMQTCQCQKEPWYFLFLFFCFVFIFTMMILFLWHASWYYGIFWCKSKTMHENDREHILILCNKCLCWNTVLCFCAVLMLKWVPLHEYILAMLFSGLVINVSPWAPCLSASVPAQSVTRSLPAGVSGYPDIQH